MLGYPGSGKTTTAQIVHELTGAIHLWADLERRKRFEHPTHAHQENLALYAELNHEVDLLLGEGKSVIFDTNFNFYKDRQVMRDIAARHGARVRLLWLTTPKQLSKVRATQLAEDQQTRVLGDMPAKTFDRISNNLEPPRPSEPHITLDGTKITPDYVKRRLRLK